MRHRRRLAALMAVAGLAVAGCGEGPLGAASADGGAAVETVTADAAVDLLETRDDLDIIDVRTPEEHADGHLVDATLLDFASGAFEEEVGDLDRDQAYLLYCRTGNRSGQAAAIMEELGFTDVVDAGAYDELAAAGAAVVTP